MWPLINVTARLAGQGPAVIQVGILSELVFLVTGLHETLENTNECDSDSEVVKSKGYRGFSRIPQDGPLNGGLNAQPMSASETPLRVV